MTLQRILIVALTTLLPFWGWGFYSQFSADEVASPDTPAPQKKTVTAKPPRLSLNPRVQPPLPDLNQGYLFNNERSMKSSGITTTNNQLNMETLQYDGSLIIGETRKAVVSFATDDKSQPAQRSKKNSAIRRRPQKATRNSRTLSLGDTVAGYTLISIEPMLLTFTQGSNEIKKEFFAAEKIRQAPAKTKQARPVSAPKKNHGKKSSHKAEIATAYR